MIIVGDARQMDTSQFGRYGVIVADPPWPYDVPVGRGAIKHQYKTMTMAEIWAMPVSKLASDDCALFLWGTWPKLPQVLTTCFQWGFEYVTGLPWIKMSNSTSISYGIGHWVRGCSEFIFIGKRGNVSPPRLEGFLGLLSPNLQHSRKPDSVHEIAEALPGPYLELFARRPRPGWDVFGNDIKAELAGLPLFAAPLTQGHEIAKEE